MDAFRNDADRLDLGEFAGHGPSMTLATTVDALKATVAEHTEKFSKAGDAVLMLQNQINEIIETVSMLAKVVAAQTKPAADLVDPED